MSYRVVGRNYPLVNEVHSDPRVRVRLGNTAHRRAADEIGLVFGVTEHAGGGQLDEPSLGYRVVITRDNMPYQRTHTPYCSKQADV